jgi:hypothetical protein
MRDEEKLNGTTAASGVSQDDHPPFSEALLAAMGRPLPRLLLRQATAAL